MHDKTLENINLSIYDYFSSSGAKRPTTTKAEVRLTSTYVVVGHFVPDEERLILLKPFVQFYFTYGVSRGYLYIYLYFKHQFLDLL